MTSHPDGLIAHRMIGDGPPLLLLNGIAMSMSSWEPVARPLEDSYRVIRCDFRGQLLSPGPPPREVARHVVDVVAVLDHLGIESCHVVATSFGGAVGALLAARHPQRVRSLVSIASATGFTAGMADEVRRWRRAALDSMHGPDRGALFDVFEEVVYSAAWVATHEEDRQLRRRQVASLPDAWFEGLAGLLDSADSFSFTTELATVRCPTLVVAAEHDAFIPLPRSRALAEAIPDAELRILAGAGHAAVVERPAELTALCMEFLAAIG